MTLTRGDAIAELGRLQSSSIDLVLSDPPFGNDTHYGRNHKRIAGDAHPLTGLSVLQECHRVLKPDSALFFFLDVRHLPIIRLFVDQYTAFTVRDVLIWDKMNMGFGFGFRKRYEMILALEKGRPEYRSKGLPNVLQAKRLHSASHPHEKPAKLLKTLICQTTNAGDVVLDPFMGSGSTGVAAVETARAFHGIEIDGAHFKAAKRRIERAEAAASSRIAAE